MFGNNLKTYRVKSGMTQKQLAEKVNVVQSFIAQLERGTKQASPPILQELSKIFGCTIDELVNGSKETA